MDHIYYYGRPCCFPCPTGGVPGPQGEPGPAGATGATGPQGEPGPTGATGATGAVPTDSAASYYNFQAQLTSGEQIPVFSQYTDPQGNIVQSNTRAISLAAGNYLVSYKISVTLNRVYFATTANGSSAVGSAHFIIQAAGPTTFFLTYSGADASNGEVNLTLLRLRDAT